MIENPDLVAALKRELTVSNCPAEGTALRGGRPKRHYAIDPAGLRALNAAKAETDRLWAGLRAPLKGAI